jgi:cell division protein FtsN
VDSSNEHTTTALYRAAIGPVNTEYYLKIFAKFETANRASAQWNWAAALNTINWMVFRKLWIPALAYTGCVLGVLLVVFGIGGLVFKFSDAVRIGLALLFAGAAVAMPGFYGTALFHNTCRKKMAHALIATPTLTEACTLLNRQASQRPRLLGIGLANLALLGILFGLVAGLRRPDPETIDPEARNIAVGRAIEDTPLAPVAAESSPLAAASSPIPQTEAAPLPSTPTSAPLPAPLPEPLPEPLPAPTPVPLPAVTLPPPPTLPPLPPLPPKPAVKAPPKATPVPQQREAKAVVKPAATPAAKPSAPTEAKATVFLINVGLFADENNARNAKTKLVDAGLSAFTEEAIYPRGKRTRVRVGPFETLAEADAAAEKIRNLGLEAAVFKQ